MNIPYYENTRFGQKDYFTISEGSDITFPPHMHMYNEMLFLINGEVEMTINSQKRLMKSGDLGIALSNDIHSYKTYDESRFIMIIFSPEYIIDTITELGKKGYGFETPFLLSDDNSEEIRRCLFELDEEYKKDRSQAVIKGYLNVLFGRLVKKLKIVHSNDSKKGYSINLQKIMMYIQENYKQRMTLDDISLSTGLNKYYISHIFKEALNYSLNDYINMLRVDHAQKLISVSDKTILEIAFDCGFESQRHFNRVFKSLTGVVPSVYKKQNREH